MGISGFRNPLIPEILWIVIFEIQWPTKIEISDSKITSFVLNFVMVMDYELDLAYRLGIFKKNNLIISVERYHINFLIAVHHISMYSVIMKKNLNCETEIPNLERSVKPANHF